MNPTEIFLVDLCVWCLGHAAANKKLATKLIREFVLWKWSTRHGKYKGCEYWSENALEQYRNDDDNNLRHEHVIPRTFLTKLLMEIPTERAMNEKKVSDTLSNLCLGCVLTEDEDNLIPGYLISQMPKDWNGTDLWARYREAFNKSGITILKVNWTANGPSVIELRITHIFFFDCRKNRY